MKIDILDIDKLIKVNQLQEVTSRFLYFNKNEFHPDGIMSNEIFGISNHDRRFTYAYISLSKHFIHPYVYNYALKAVFQGILGVISGTETYSVQNGLLVKDENGWTGLDELYNHWNEIRWKDFKSANKNAIQILSKKSRDEIFIDKFIVCPPVPYRDVKRGQDVDPSDRTNQLNKLYQRLLQFVSLLKLSSMTVKFQQYTTEQSIQDTLCQIYEYFISRIEKKFGLIKRSLMGKSIDYGVRSVISAPMYHNNKFEDNLVDMEHCALPISQAIVAFKPFVVAYLKDFFTRELINRADSYIAKDADKFLYVKLYNPDIQFSDKTIETMISNYIYNPDSRFNVITVDFIDPKNPDRILTAPLYIKGRRFLSENNSQELYRRMTVTDLLYLASVDAAEKRHVMISRYPVGTDKGIFFNKVRIQSTIEHERVYYNGKEYKFFPKINDKSITNVKTSFQDTTSFSNSYLSGLGGDYNDPVVIVTGNSYNAIRLTHNKRCA